MIRPLKLSRIPRLKIRSTKFNTIMFMVSISVLVTLLLVGIWFYRVDLFIFNMFFSTEVTSEKSETPNLSPSNWSSDIYLILVGVSHLIASLAAFIGTLITAIRGLSLKQKTE